MHSRQCCLATQGATTLQVIILKIVHTLETERNRVFCRVR